MKVAIDFRPLQQEHKNTEICRYITDVFQAAPENEDVSFICIRFGGSDPVRELGLLQGADYDEIIIQKRSPGRTVSTLLRYALSNLIPQFKGLKALRPDVFYQPDYLLGLPRIWRCKKVVLSYDLTPLKFRSVYLPSWRKFATNRSLGLKAKIRLSLRAQFYRKKYKNGLRALRKANRVISVSACTTKDLVTIARVREDRISTIPLAIPQPALTEPSKEVKQTVNNISLPILCFAGSVDRRHHIQEIIHAHNLLNAHGTRSSLVLIGAEFLGEQKLLSQPLRKALNESSYSTSIHLLGEISLADELYLLGRSTAFVNPSDYEGFSVPVLEAMQAGCPVLTYKNSALVEIGRDSVVYVDPEDGAGIMSSFEQLLKSEALREKTKSSGKKQASKFVWTTTFSQTWGKLTSW